MASRKHSPLQHLHFASQMTCDNSVSVMSFHIHSDPNFRIASWNEEVTSAQQQQHQQQQPQQQHCSKRKPTQPKRCSRQPLTSASTNPQKRKRDLDEKAGEALSKRTCPATLRKSKPHITNEAEDASPELLAITSAKASASTGQITCNEEAETPQPRIRKPLLHGSPKAKRQNRDAQIQAQPPSILKRRAFPERRSGLRSQTLNISPLSPAFADPLQQSVKPPSEAQEEASAQYNQTSTKGRRNNMADKKMDSQDEMHGRRNTRRTPIPSQKVREQQEIKRGMVQRPRSSAQSYPQSRGNTGFEQDMGYGANAPTSPTPRSEAGYTRHRPGQAAPPDPSFMYAIHTTPSDIELRPDPTMRPPSHQPSSIADLPNADEIDTPFASPSKSVGGKSKQSMRSGTATKDSGSPVKSGRTMQKKKPEASLSMNDLASCSPSVIELDLNAAINKLGKLPASVTALRNRLMGKPGYMSRTLQVKSASPMSWKHSDRCSHEN